MSTVVQVENGRIEYIINHSKVLVHLCKGVHMYSSGLYRHGRRVLNMPIAVLFAVFPLFSQENLIVNGDFSSDSGWNSLGQYNDGQGTGTVEDGAYIIDITSGGTEVWSIQFRQTGIPLDSGRAYTFSYTLSASIERTVEVSLSRDGGDYISYSGRDTVSIGPEQQRFERTFVMKHPTDSNVRLEFNCGKAEGRISIRDVRLILFSEPLLSVNSPDAGEIIYTGVPYTLSWYSINIENGMDVDLSVDNGSTWETIGTLDSDTGSFLWIPEPVYSPWCRIRVVSRNEGGPFSINDGPFEIAPLRELIQNGRFSSTSDGWNLGVYGGNATGSVENDSYRIIIESSGSEPWHIQLVQSGIPLEKDQAYICSFTASAVPAADIQINIGEDKEPFDVYLDTTEKTISLTEEPEQYSQLFVMRFPDDSNSRLEFNCGLIEGTVVFDNISLIPEYKAPVKMPYGLKHCATACLKVHYTIRSLLPRHPFHIFHNGSGVCRVFDLKGRSTGLIRANTRNAAAGMYLTAPSKAKKEH